MLLRGDKFELRLFQSNAELFLTPTDTVLVPACVKRFEMSGEGEVVCANFIYIKI